MTTFLNPIRFTLAIALCFATAQSAMSQAFPSRPLTVFVPAPVGSGADVTARLVARAVEKRIGKPVVVETVTGANGVIGTQRMLSQGRPDGHTVLFGMSQIATINRVVYKNLGYDADKLKPVTRIGEIACLWITHKDTPFNTFEEWIEAGRKSPGKYTISILGPASLARLASERLMLSTGARFTLVPYASANAIPDFLAGRVDVRFEPTNTAPQVLASGRAKVLAYSAGTRSSQYPDVPTANERVPGNVATTWYAVWTNDGTPEPIVAELTKLFNDAVNDPEVQEALRKQAINPIAKGPQELADATRKELAELVDLVKKNPQIVATD